MFFCQSDYCSSDRRLLPGAENSVVYRLDRDKAMSRDSIKGFSETTKFFWPVFGRFVNDLLPPFRLDGLLPK